MIDTAGIVSTNTAHGYAECSNKGLCDRLVGQCECLPGYDGHACQRASCPSKSIEKLQNASKDKLESKFLFQNGKVSSTTTSSVFTGSFLTTIQVDTCSGHGTCKSVEDLAREDNNNIYSLWDKDSSMACDCDPG